MCHIIYILVDGNESDSTSYASVLEYLEDEKPNASASEHLIEANINENG